MFFLNHLVWDKLLSVLLKNVHPILTQFTVLIAEVFFFFAQVAF